MYPPCINSRQHGKQTLEDNDGDDYAYLDDDPEAAEQRAGWECEVALLLDEDDY